MKTVLKGIVAALGIVVGAAAAGAAEYPLIKPVEQNWSFAGPFGTYDRGELQRGLKVYREGCAACHGLERVAFRTLEDLGYSEAQVRALAGEYEIEDGPDANGDMFMRTAIPSDYFPSPFPNAEAAAASNNGAAPPDLSLIAKARAVERGFPLFVFDIFTQYAESGPDYIYNLLVGYEEAPEGYEQQPGTYYNPHFIAGTSLSMAPPLQEGMISYDDGSPETVEQYAHDVTAFLMWAAEPHMEDRKRMGFVVMLFLIGFAVLVYLTKRKIWSNVAH
jgi:ubiquinol-cytochrome c reductase cytochrome c1 subunit